jgi:hypothetical protein
VFVARLVRGRARLRDQAVLLFFLLNLLYIVLFRRGSSIHLYRVFYFSAFFALAVMDLLVELRDLLFRRAGARAAAIGGVVLTLFYFATTLPHSLHNLVDSRVVMGTHGFVGYNPDYAKLMFARAAGTHTPQTAFAVFYHLPYRLEFTYYFDRSYGVSPWGELSTLAQLDEARKQHPQLVLLTQKGLPAAEDRRLRELLQHHRAYAYDSFLLVRLDEEIAQPELHEYRFVARPPSWLWWWFYSHKYPPLEAVEVSTPFGDSIRAAAAARPASITSP